MNKKQLKLAIRYYKRGLTLRQIGRLIGMSGAGIGYHFKKNKIPVRPSGVLRKSLKIETKKLEQNLKQELGDKADRLPPNFPQQSQN
jgi:hypothetical protein